MSYEGKTKEELIRELEIQDAIKKEREVSDEKYAIKLVEKIVFALISLITIAVIVAVVKLVVAAPSPNPLPSIVLPK